MTAANSPIAVAVSPVSSKIYVDNEGRFNATVIDQQHHAAHFLMNS